MTTNRWRLFLPPDPTPDPEPVIHVIQHPQYVDQADGTVRAYYPAEDWYVVGADREEAGNRLVEESARRMQDHAYLVQRFETAKQHLYGGEVTPGFEVDTLSAENYQQRAQELGEQLRRPED
jgi:hypothetical protein